MTAAPAPHDRPVLLGLDVVEVQRVGRLVRGFSDGELRHVFTRGELARAEAARNPQDCYAVCLAAKEAVGKALGVGLGGIDWSDVDTTVGAGSLHVTVTGTAAVRAASLGVLRWHASHSLCAGQATVQVVACR